MGEIIKEHGVPIDPSILKFAGELYPTDAAVVLALSRTKHWTSQIDKFLEVFLAGWLANNITTPEEYLKNLIETLHKEDCIEDMYAKLNLIAIVNPADSISIRTQNKTLKVQTADAQKGQQNLRQFLINQGKFTANIDTLYNILKHTSRTYTIEQSLLSWIGHLIIRTVAEKLGSDARLEADSIMVNHQKVKELSYKSPS